METAVSNAVGGFGNLVTTPLPQNLDFFELFPNGVYGAPLGYQMDSRSISDIIPGAADQWSGLGVQLTNYLGLLNEISTLYNRANYLYNAVYQESFDAVNNLGIS